MMPLRLTCMAALALLAVCALAQTGSSASISVEAEGNKTRYDFAPTETCVIAAFGKRPLGLSVVLTSDEASLHVDMPNIDAKHANEIQVVLVVAAPRSAGGAQRVSTVTHEIDTRPDAVLDKMQKAERAGKGIKGKATTTLMEQGGNAMLTFSGVTAAGVRLAGEVTCRKVTGS